MSLTILWPQLSSHVVTRFENFGVHHGKRRNLGIPFQQRRNAAGFLMRQAIQFPNWVGHMIIVRVDQMRAARSVAGQVHLHDSLVRQIANVLDRVEIVIHARDVNVVDVEQQAAIGFFGHAREKFPFGHRGAGKRDIAAGIFQHQRPFQEILHGAARAGSRGAAILR